MINPFKRKPKPKTIIHKDYKKLIEHCVTIKDENGKEVDLYEFKNADDIPIERYDKFNEFMEDMRRGINRADLEYYNAETIRNAELGTAQGNANVLNIQNLVRVRMKIAYDIDLMLRFISVALFTIEEDVYKYDWDIGTWKIDCIQESGLSRFFLSQPIKKYWTRQDLSVQDFEIIIAQRELKKQTLEQLKTIGVFG